MLKTESPQNTLDLGCGNGVLFLAAVKALNIPAPATDIDQGAINVTLSNAKTNGVNKVIKACQADGLEHQKIQIAAPFDLVFVNILAGPLVKRTLKIAKAVKSGRFVILSGLLDRQARNVISAYQAEGFSVIAVRTMPIGRLSL